MGDSNIKFGGEPHMQVQGPPQRRVGMEFSKPWTKLSLPICGQVFKHNPANGEIILIHDKRSFLFLHVTWPCQQQFPPAEQSVDPELREGT
eukprot:7904158-Pyramimonas_sp.AAC.1